MADKTIMQKIMSFAKLFEKHVKQITRHIAREHAEYETDLLKTESKIIPPSENYQYGGILATSKVAGVLPDENANLDVYNKQPRQSETPGELAMTKQKTRVEAFQKVRSTPQAWQEAARVINIRYHAAAAINFATSRGLIVLDKFCKEKYKDLKNINLAELTSDILQEINRQDPENIKEYRKFLEFGFIKTRHSTINDYRTLVVFNADTWRYSAFQGMTTPFLYPDEAEAVNEASKGKDIKVKFTESCGLDELPLIAHRHDPVKISFVHNPVEVHDPGYFDKDVLETKKKLEQAANSIYYVDFNTGEVPDNKYFKMRREHIEQMEDKHYQMRSDYAKITDIPYASKIKDLMADINNKLHVYYHQSGMEMQSMNWDITHTHHRTTKEGGLITGFTGTMRTTFNSLEQARKFGDIYEKAHWIGNEHQRKHIETVKEYFKYPRDHDIDRMYNEYQKNVDKLPKNDNGEPIFPKNYRVDDYKRICAAYESLHDENKFAYHVHNNAFESYGCSLPYNVDENKIGIKPFLDQTTEITFNNANPNDALRITTMVECAPSAYVSSDQITHGRGRYKEMMSETLPVSEDFGAVKEAIINHYQKIHPEIDIKQLAELTDYAKIKECSKNSAGYHEVQQNEAEYRLVLK